MLPRLAISMGDPAGIGPEVTLKAMGQPNVLDVCCPILVGDLEILQAQAEALSEPCCLCSILCPISSVDEVTCDGRSVNVLNLKQASMADFTPGTVGAASGKAAVEYVLEAGRLALNGQVDAVVTGPINKEAIRLGGYNYIGHTEIFAELCRDAHATTMLITGQLRVVHVTRHVPLREVADLITAERVLDAVRVTHSGMSDLGFEHPRVGVAGLNPHNGDNGLMGDEEIVAIGPAVEQARNEGIEATGPIPADSIFFRALRGEFDVVVAMYHDQGHIPIKTHGFERSVTLTLGLPIIRTSVDHGTAFDIAWQGKADPTSMVEAIQLAAALVQRKSRTAAGYKTYTKSGI